jgi:hypothetical protein
MDEALDVTTLRMLFRNLLAFRALYEDCGIDEITSPDGVTFSLWDLERLYDCVPQLPVRQAQAIEWCLVRGEREKDVAVRMGLKPNNPVAMYATLGLQKLIEQHGGL